MVENDGDNVETFGSRRVDVSVVGTDARGVVGSGANGRLVASDPDADEWCGRTDCTCII